MEFEALEEYLPSGPTSGAPNAPVFPELHGKQGSGKSGLSMAFKRIMAKAGIDAGVIRERSGAAGRSVSALSFHSLRYSSNSALANAGVSQELRQKLTGHASAGMNIIYTTTSLKPSGAQSRHCRGCRRSNRLSFCFTQSSKSIDKMPRETDVNLADRKGI
jgi:integrase